MSELERAAQEAFEELFASSDRNLSPRLLVRRALEILVKRLKERGIACF